MSDEKRINVKSRLINILDNATRFLRSRPTPHAHREPESWPLEPWDLTKKGNAISPVSHSEWISDATGEYETRHHVGRSVEGYHGGYEVSRLGGDGVFSWTNARQTPDAAERASYRMHDFHEQQDQSANAKLSAEWRGNHALARQRNEARREPERMPQTAPRRRPSWER